MTNNYYTILFFLIFICVKSNAQKTKLISTINDEVTFLAADNIGNFFIVDNSGEVTKYDNEFKKKQTYKSALNGEISSISAFIPLEVFLFYKDINRFVILDNTLSEKTTVNFEKIGLTQIALACPSYDRGIWVYDYYDFQIKKIDTGLNIVQKSGNLSALLGFEINPNTIIESDDWLYLNDPEQGILVFDMYGNYFKTIPIKGLEKMNIKSDLLYFTEEKKLNIYNLKNQLNEIIEMDHDLEEITNFELVNQYIYLTSKSEVKVYLTQTH